MVRSCRDTGWGILLAFLVVAVVEEGTKFFFLHQKTWHSPYFNYRYDAIVYAVFVSLGFAAFENVKYIFNYGLSVALHERHHKIDRNFCWLYRGDVVVAACLFGAVISARFANRCDMKKLNRVIGSVLLILGVVTILLKI